MNYEKAYWEEQELYKLVGYDYNAYMSHAIPQNFYNNYYLLKPDGSPFGAIALTEGTETILPKMPQNEYAVDGKRVADWKMVLVSTTKDGIIGDCDYQKALKKLEKNTLDSNENTILIKGLSLDELEAIVE